ncbi:MAG: ATP-binding protein [Oscillatoria sp. PMC 1068.18]|nr:ATP-binding protein [Oscillatoria sp. PMC 1076.18]MEC4988100.1 ATP-binding protein [Oscillatoria sp. PMC 1068.18]
MSKFFKFGKRTLRVRLTAWYILLLALTLVLFCSYLYLQLEQSLLAQLDSTLQVTVSQTLDRLIEKNGHPGFKKTAADPLAQADLAVRLIDDQGKVWDGFGNYEILPSGLPITSGYINLSRGDRTWRIYTQSLPNFESDRVWLQVAESLEPVYQASEHLLALMWLGFPLILLIAGLGGLFLADRALRPIDRIIRTAQVISANDFTKRINYLGATDEVSRLAMTIDQMLDRLEVAFERERRFTADAAHELRTPLTVIKGRIEVTRSRDRTATEYEKTLHDLEHEADRLIRLTNGLLFLARLESQQRHPSFLQLVDLSNLLSALSEQMQPLAEVQQIELLEKVAPNLFIRGNPDYLTNLFLNLLDNAFKYTPKGGTVTVEAFQTGEQISIAVKDTGIGIDRQHLISLFDRFYRVEEARSRRTGGAGLGLAIAQQIARLHDATLTVQSQPQQGTTFYLILPKSHQKLA